MTYDSTTQARPVMLDGEELKIGDEVIIARGPTNPDNDSLWTGSMARLVGRRGAVEHGSTNLDSDIGNYGAPVVHIRVDGNLWWFRLSELSRPATYHQAAPVQPQAQPEPDTPTAFHNLVAFNETTGPGPLHPAVDSPRSPYDPYFLTNERRLCPYDDTHGTLSLRPGFDAYLTHMEFEQAQKRRRERFAAWRDDRDYQRNQFLRRIRDQLTTHPFSDSRKGRCFKLTHSRADKLYYAKEFARLHKSGRDSARIIGKLTGHFHPTRRRALPDDEVFVLLRKYFRKVEWRARDAIFVRPNHPINPVMQAYVNAVRKLGSTWQYTPWQSSASDVPAYWFFGNEAALARIPHISTVNPQEVAYYQSVDKLIRGIETRTKPGRFLAKFFLNLTPDQVRQYANDYLVATAPKQLHFARTMQDIITAIDEGPSESCQTRGYYDKNPDDRPWYAGHIHPAACYASGDFEVAYITDNNKPASLIDLHAGAQRITARAICNAENKTVARIYGDSGKLLPLLTSAGYAQVERALVGCRLLKIENEEGSGWIMPYVDAGIGSGGGSLEVDDYYDHESGRSYWMLVRPENGTYSTYEGYDKKGVLEGDEEERHYCDRCNAAHDDADDIHYSDYEGEYYCSECEDDFVSAVVGVSRYGNNYDMVLIDNAIEIDGDWYVNDDELLAKCGFVQCIHCDEWESLDNTTTTDSGQVCCQHQIVELAEESPEGNEYGYRPDCTQYVNTETGETVWLDDGTDVDDFTTDDDTPKYVNLEVWREMQQRQESFEFVGPPKHNPTPTPQFILDDLRI